MAVVYGLVLSKPTLLSISDISWCSVNVMQLCDHQHEAKSVVTMFLFFQQNVHPAPTN